MNAHRLYDAECIQRGRPRRSVRSEVGMGSPWAVWVVTGIQRGLLGPEWSGFVLGIDDDA